MDRQGGAAEGDSGGSGIELGRNSAPEFLPERSVREVLARDAIHGPVRVEPVDHVRFQLRGTERLRMTVQHCHVVAGEFVVLIHV